MYWPEIKWPITKDPNGLLVNVFHTSLSSHKLEIYVLDMLLKMKIYIKIYMNILSVTLMAMTGVTADGLVRAYLPSLFVCYMYVPQLFVSRDGESDCVTKSHGKFEFLCEQLNKGAPAHQHSEFGCQQRIDCADKRELMMIPYQYLVPVPHTVQRKLIVLCSHSFVSYPNCTVPLHRTMPTYNVLTHICLLSTTEWKSSC